MDQMNGIETNAVNDAIGTTKTTAERIEDALTITWEHLQPWQRDNQYIQTGYRPASDSYSKSAASLSYIHNETVNIYTHLIGAALAGVAGIALYSSIKPRYDKATHVDVLVFSCYFLGAVVCLGMSATYHTISNHSDAVAKIGNKLDYFGIVFLIWGSFVPSIYYGFSADPGLIKTYWTMITTIAAVTATICISPKFRTSAWRPFRAFMFVAVGLSAVVPVLHGVKLYGVAQMERQMGLSFVVTQGGLYIVGAVIYVARVPERIKPGAFDIWGSSHQIFHVLVVLAAATHLVGLLKAFDYEHSSRLTLMAAYDRARRMLPTP